MHSFLPAVGFSNIKNRQMLEPIYREILHSPTKKAVSAISADTRMVQFDKKFGDGFGISLVGEMAIDGSISIEYYFPFVRSGILTDGESICVEKHADKNSYAGVANDFSLGMTLIFFITNVSDYVQSLWTNTPNLYISRTFFSGLSTNGTIILDVDKKDIPKPAYANARRDKLIEAAKKGDPAAIESLTLEDMDTYNLIGKRAQSEDVLSIVESSFMPVGIETDHYAVIGNIIGFKSSRNTFTGESVYLLDIRCNDLTFTTAINQKDLFGEPAVGRRFKGDVWLQGHILLS